MPRRHDPWEGLFLSMVRPFVRSFGPVHFLDRSSGWSSFSFPRWPWSKPSVLANDYCATTVRERLSRRCCDPRCVSVCRYHADDMRLETSGFLESFFAESDICSRPVLSFGRDFLRSFGSFGTRKGELGFVNYFLYPRYPLPFALPPPKLDGSGRSWWWWCCCYVI